MKKPATKPGGFKTLWSRQSVRVGAAIALLGGAIGAIANISAVIDLITPDETTTLVADARSAAVSADAKIDELLKLMRVQAALTGGDIDPQSEEMIRAAMQAILTSGDVRKAAARKALEEGDVESAAGAIALVARQQGEAAGGAAKAAAESWKEAAALQAPSDPAAAIAAYEEARRLDPDDLDTWTRLASTHYARGDFDAAQAINEEVLRRAAPESSEYGWAKLGLGAVALARGATAEAEALFKEGERIALKLGDPRLIAAVGNSLSIVTRRRGEFEAAEKLLRRSIEHAHKAGSPAYEARALGQLGLVTYSRGDPEGGAALLRQALAIYESRGELRHQATIVGNLGAMALAQGDVDTAAGYIEQSVALGERLGLKQSVAEDYVNLAELARQKGDFDLAQRHIDKAATLAGEIGLASLTPYVVAVSAQIAQGRGDLVAACALYAEAIAGFAQMQDSVGQEVARYMNEAGCGAT